MKYLDGIRGLAALYVMLNHGSIMTMLLTKNGTDLSKRPASILHFIHFYILNYGTYAVAIFIVLSGYLLMLPVVRDPDMKLKGGLKGFFFRRARRILPPYYAAMFLCLLLIMNLQSFGIDRSQMAWAKLVTGSLSFGCVVSHLFMFYDFTRWYTAIDPPMWSVVIEWQIYFLFGLVLLPFLKRFKPILTIAFVVAVFIVPVLLGNNIWGNVHSWFVFLFLVGMLGACVNFSKEPIYITLRHCGIWLYGAIFFLLSTLAVTLVADKLRINLIGGTLLPETLTGLAVVCFIIHSTNSMINGYLSPNVIVKFLQTPLVDNLGAFSYSLYLIHDPVLEIVYYILKVSHMSGLMRWVLFAGAGFPLAICIAYLFHLLFEKPFLHNLNTKQPRQEVILQV